MNRQWLSRGIVFIGDLMEGNRLLTYDELQSKYRIRINFIEYNSIKVKMRPILRQLTQRRIEPALPRIPPRTFVVLNEEHLSRLIRRSLLRQLDKNNESINQKLRDKWALETQEYNKASITAIMKITKSTYLHSLHYKIANRVIATNKFLHMVGISETSLCTFCHTSQESTGHLFYCAEN